MFQRHLMKAATAAAFVITAAAAVSACGPARTATSPSSSPAATRAATVKAVTAARSSRPPQAVKTGAARTSGNPATVLPPASSSQPPVPASPSQVPAACYPLTSGGRCYSPGEFCGTADHGMTGTDGDGKAIACEDVNGWRWEAA